MIFGVLRRHLLLDLHRGPLLILFHLRPGRRQRTKKAKASVADDRAGSKA